MARRLFNGGEKAALYLAAEQLVELRRLLAEGGDN